MTNYSGSERVLSVRLIVTMIACALSIKASILHVYAAQQWCSIITPSRWTRSDQVHLRAQRSTQSTANDLLLSMIGAAASPFSHSIDRCDSDSIECGAYGKWNPSAIA